MDQILQQQLLPPFNQATSSVFSLMLLEDSAAAKGDFKKPLVGFHTI